MILDISNYLEGEASPISYAYKKTRNGFYNAPYYDVYKYGVKEIPNGAGRAVAKKLAKDIGDQLYTDLMREIT